MEHADGDKCKIVFISPEAMMEFSGGKKLKLSLSARQKNLLTYGRLKGQGIFSLDKNKILRLQVTLDCFHISNRPLPIHAHSHEISNFLDTETAHQILSKCKSLEC